MTSRIGSDQNFIATTSAGILDDQANSIVSSDTTFGSSPLGVAARTQALFGIANANFNLTPPDPTLPIVDNDNPLPYWTIENGTEGDGSAIAVFDDATSTWGVELSLGTSITDAAISMTTRSFLLNDDNLALRQKALSVLSKSGTAGGTAAEWQLVLSAEYFSEAGSSLSTHAIGTVTDVTTWTSIAGTTTAGGSAINSSAAYVDLTFTMTALGTVTGSAKATIKSLLLQTSTPATGGGGGFLIAETYLTSGTWTRPTGVDYVTVVGLSGGQGGQAGALTVGSASTSAVFGGAGGGSGRWFMMRDIALGTAASVSVGVGAGGAGGTAMTFTKAASGTATSTQSESAAEGGATTFGSFFSIPGGGAGGGVTQLFYNVGGGSAAQVDGGNGAQSGTAKNGKDGTLSAFTLGAPFTEFVSGGVAGAAASGSGGSSGTASIGGVAGTVAGIGGGGGGGGNGTASSSPSISAGGIGGASGAGSGGGGAVRRIGALGQTIVVTGGAGGSAIANTGAGGGGGGCAGVAANSTANYVSAAITANSGAGGDGGSGFVTVVYVG